MRRALTILFVFLAVPLAAALLLTFAVILVYPTLPSLEALTDYRPKIPLQVFTADGVLIGEFGEERRALVRIEDVPEMMKRAIVAAEDERFYMHGGVDYVGVARAAWSNFTSGGVKQGASTITMQVARNFFLSREKTFSRKFNEMLLAFKIEHSLSKDQILQLYINQIFLGQRAFGFAAAARIYFGKSLENLSIAEMAMLAGLPKAPSRFNPVANLKRATARQHYVLGRMRDLGDITDAQYQAALAQQLAITGVLREYALHADHFAEMIRQAMYDRYQEEAYHRGYRVYTTLDSRHQRAAYEAVRAGVLAYDRRHGYRGPEAFVDLPAGASDDVAEDVLQDFPDSDDLLAAVVVEAHAREVRAVVRGGERITIRGDGLKFSLPALSEKASANQRIRRGAIVRVRKDAKGGWAIVQLPQVEASLVSIDPRDGAIRALVGGFDFKRNKYNHVTQALRQPGSSFKPFIYSAALEKGFTPATIINDAPLRFEAQQTGSEAWEPHNYDGTFDGPMRLRTALAKSKNLVSVRILQDITPQYAQDYIARFGFDPKLHPAYLTMALGAGNVTPMQMVVGYSVLANGGFRVMPYFIERIEDPRGKVLAKAQPRRAGEGADRVVDARNAFLMSSLLQEVVRSGTAGRAMQLGRSDLAGKTGTTNDFVDAWFAGYQTGLVAVAWIGFDNPRSLGRNETGSRAALPMWMSYMGDVLEGVPQQALTPPPGIMSAHIDPLTGLRLEIGGVNEYFYQESLPPEQPLEPPLSVERPSDEVRNQLF
ncbi:MAG: PBP1A family penicillin-binding protein [Betaproteobacteria bacterium]|nr:PBP1A family penicillin-binding protein [Betaproteobacteria bacterium]